MEVILYVAMECACPLLRDVLSSFIEVSNVVSCMHSVVTNQHFIMIAYKSRGQPGGGGRRYPVSIIGITYNFNNE